MSTPDHDTTTPPERPKQTCYGCGALHIPEHLRRDPTVEELQSHTFNAVWDVIKHVDVHFAGGLKSGATGNDVIALLQLTGVAAAASPGWQPIATVPRDGKTRVVVWMPDDKLDLATYNKHSEPRAILWMIPDPPSPAPKEAR